VRTVRRHQTRYAQGGMAALAREAGWRRGRRRISGKRLRTIETLKSQGMSNRAIAHRLGVSEMAIRKLVGPSKPTDIAQPTFAGITTATAEKPPATHVPSAPSVDDEVDRVTPPAENSASDRNLITADGSEPVPMSASGTETGGGVRRRARVALVRPACAPLALTIPRHHVPSRDHFKCDVGARQAAAVKF